MMRPDVLSVAPEELLSRGVRLVFLDVDNTLMPYGENETPQALKDWSAGMKAAGLELFILSNNRGVRPSHFAGALSIGFVGRAHKPGTKKLLEICRERRLAPEQCALIGDQIYTDVLCAVRAGALAVLVRPIRLSNPLLAVRYAMELPFRLLGKRKGKGES